MAFIPMDGVQIMYPIYTTIHNDKAIVELDNFQYATTQVNSVSKRFESCSLTLKIRQSNFATFYTFIKNNFGKLVQIAQDGFSVFISNTTNQDAYIIGYTSPVRESLLFYSMTIELRKA